MINKTNMGGPAFGHGDPGLEGDPGMTLWDAYFIAAIGTVDYLPSNERTSTSDLLQSMGPDEAKICAADAARLADAMLAERAKREEES